LQQKYDRERKDKTLLADLRGPEMPEASVSPGPDDAPRVLVVEDNADLRAFMTSVMASEFRVATAADGQDGWEKLHKLQPDIVLSDINMPRMTGHELCKKIKADPMLASTPVIMLTARGGLEATVEGLDLGADD